MIPLYSPGQEKIELKHADKLTGKVIDGTSVREASGSVKFIQGNVTVFCNSAVQYIEANKIELTGDVKLFQDTVSLYTSKAIYTGNDKTANCEGGVTLKDPNATIRSNRGVYYFNDAKAIFKGDVIIINPQYKITSDELTYLRNTEDSYAKGKVIVTTDSAVISAENINFFKRQGKTFAFSDVKIISDSTTIQSDTLTNYSFEKKSIASGNVRIDNPSKSTTVYGNYLENYEQKNYTIIKGKAKLIRVGNEGDTLFIYSLQMEAFRNPPEYYVAKDSVEIIRGDFLAKCGNSTYFSPSEKSPESIAMTINPVLWQDNMQMTGDSISSEIESKKLKSVTVKKLPGTANSINSFLLINNKNVFFPDRYDQITGTDLKLTFKESKLTLANVYKNSQSIYFIYEENKGNGTNISDGENMVIYFDDEQKVSKIRIDKDAKGQFVPETLMSTVTLTLPGFEPRTDKPVRR